MLGVRTLSERIRIKCVPQGIVETTLDERLPGLAQLFDALLLKRRQHGQIGLAATASGTRHVFGLAYGTSQHHCSNSLARRHLDGHARMIIPESAGMILGLAFFLQVI